MQAISLAIPVKDRVPIINNWITLAHAWGSILFLSDGNWDWLSIWEWSQYISQSPTIYLYIYFDYYSKNTGTTVVKGLTQQPPILDTMPMSVLLVSTAQQEPWNRINVPQEPSLQLLDWKLSTSALTVLQVCPTEIWCGLKVLNWRNLNIPYCG